jgi:hypothetical protein
MNTIKLVMETIDQMNRMMEKYSSSSDSVTSLEDQRISVEKELHDLETKLTKARDELLVTGQVTGGNAEIRAATLRAMVQDEQDAVDAKAMELDILKTSARLQMEDTKFGEMFILNARAKLAVFAAMISKDQYAPKHIAEFEYESTMGSVDEFLMSIMKGLKVRMDEHDNAVESN